jgi:hypothetical protein
VTSQAADVGNGTVAVSQQQFHYLTAKGGVIDEKASDIGWSINVDVKETSVSGFDLGGLHIPQNVDSPTGCLLFRPATQVQTGGQGATTIQLQSVSAT